MGISFDMSAEDIRVFLDEAEELLQMLESDIVKLEKDPGDPECLQEIFRAAHTLKGSSATLGHKKMAEVTHAMENVLDKLRKGKLSISTAVVNTLFACLDVLKAFKQEIATGEESQVTTAEILSRLASVDGQGSVAPAPVDATAAPMAGSAVSGLTPAEEEQVTQGRERGLTPYVVQITVDMNAAMPAVRAFQAIMAAQDVGQLVRSWPSQEEVEADKVAGDVKLLLLTNQPEGKVREAMVIIADLTVGEILAVPAAEASAASQPQDEAAAAMLTVDAGSPSAEKGTAGSPRPGAAAKNSSRTVRVDVEVLDNLMSLVGELVIDRTRLLQVLTQFESEREGDELTQVMSSALAHIGRMTSDLQEEIQRARMLPVDNLFKKFPRMVRDTTQKAGKEIEFLVLGEETELDRSVIEEIGDPIMHLLRNAIDHGVEPPMERVKMGKPAKGTVTLEAYHEENHIIISVRDNGRGIDPQKIKASAIRKGILTEETARRMSEKDLISLVWAAGFSTAEKVSDLSGRGVGLDVVQKNIEKLNGSVEIRSEVGTGTEFRVKLPLTLAIIRSLQVQVRDTVYCMPLGSVVETDRISTAAIKSVRGREVIVKRGEVLPLIRLVDVFQLDRAEGAPEADIFVVIVSVFSKQIGIVVDSLIGEGDVVIKPLGKFIGDIPGVSGATILGDGDVAIILDISSLINAVQAELDRAEVARS